MTCRWHRSRTGDEAVGLGIGRDLGRWLVCVGLWFGHIEVQW